MRAVWVAAGLLASAGLGCGDGTIGQLLHDLGGSGSTSGSGSGGAMTNPTGEGGAAGMSGPDAGAGSTGGSSGPDGGAASGGAPGTLTLSSALTLAPAAPNQGYTRCGTLGPEAGWQVTLAPTADHLAARTAAGTVRLLATTPLHELAQLASPLGQLDAVAFSPDGATLATVSAEMGEVTLWGAADGGFQRSFAGPPASGVDTTSAALAYSADGTRLATSLGTIIDLVAGTTTSWMDGSAQMFTLTDNPENLAFSTAGGSVPFLRFTSGDALLFVELDFEIGDSPNSTTLELRNPTTGAETVLYSMYSRGLLGYALSHDGRFIAMGTTEEGASQNGTPLGLTIFDATTGAEVANDNTSAGTVVGFSADGTEIFTQTGQTITAQSTSDLHLIDTFPLPAATTVLGVSPGNDVVGATSSAVTWFDPATGSAVRSFAYPLTAITWSSDGLSGAGTGDPAALFHFWREADGTQLGSAPSDPSTAPALSSLGQPGPNQEGQTVASMDGTVAVTNSMIIHDHATNYDALSVTDTTSGTLLRQFGAVIEGANPSAISNPGGAQLYTSSGPDVAVWCR